MVRLDKYLCDAGAGTRSEVKEIIKRGQVKVNGEVCKRPEQKVEESTAVVDYCGQTVVYEEHTYVMFYKSWTFCERSGRRGKTDLSRRDCFRWADWIRTRRGFCF